MKKKYLTWAGIASAAILAIMFIYILATGSFTIFPTAAIDPVPDHAAGDLVVITGTTNYPAATRLELEIIAVAPTPGAGTRAGATDAYIVRGTGMSNTWSGALDTSRISPGEYMVNAYWVNETDRLNAKYTLSGRLATARFRLTNDTSGPAGLGAPAMNHTLSFINIDQPGTIERGEKILVSGTTNLPPNTELIYFVIQQSNTSVFTVDPKTRKQDMKAGLTRSGLIDVMPGENGVNRWSFALDSTEFIPDQYEVLVTLENISMDKLEVEGPFGAEYLLILDAPADRFVATTPDNGPCQSILIDSLPERPGNKTYTVTGRTSLQPGTELLFTLLPVDFKVSLDPKTKVFSGPVYGATGTVNVYRGTGSTNTWSADLDLSTFPPDEYLINISTDRNNPRTYETVYGKAYCSKRITISG
jgi:hypothetical protein